jgi:hypothetical protein
MLVRNAEDAAKCGVDAAAPYAQLDEWSLLKQYREALAEQLLAPAPTLADLNWKRTVRPVHLPLDHATLNRVLDADEAWLAANKPPGRKRGPKGGPRGDVQ